MRLRDIEFGHVFNASGGRNFFHDAGYPFHKWLKPFIDLDYTGSTFVTKTTTLRERKGHMPRKRDGITPKEWFPKCIIAKPFAGVALNTVGLSGPGAMALLASRRWQKMPEPFFISFMSVERTPAAREHELRGFIALLNVYMRGCVSPYGVQINFSCPNVGVAWTHLVEEVHAALTQLSNLRVPVTVKLNALVPVAVALEISKHPACDAIVMSNTIPWGKLPEKIDWKGLFGTDTSPLAYLDPNGGGLSGKPLLPIVCDWIASARNAGFKKPIVGCGGILSREDAKAMLNAGASAIELGSISFLRPWRVRGVIKEVNDGFEKGLWR